MDVEVIVVTLAKLPADVKEREKAMRVWGEVPPIF